MLRLPDPCLVVLVGATAAGKSDWAAQWFAPEQVVSSDRLRAVVGRGRARPAREPRRVRGARPDRGQAARAQADDGDRLDRARRRSAARRGARWPSAHGVPAYAVVCRRARGDRARAQPRPRADPCRARSSPRSCARRPRSPSALAARGLRRRAPRRARSRSCRPRSVGRAGRRRPPAGGSDAARVRPAGLALRLARATRRRPRRRSPRSPAPPRRPASRASG